MKTPLILPMNFRLMPRSRAREDVAQTHRFPEFLQAPRQPVRDIWAKRSESGVIATRSGGSSARTRLLKTTSVASRQRVRKGI
jgi:hypothetical protein